MPTHPKSARLLLLVLLGATLQLTVAAAAQKALRYRWQHADTQDGIVLYTSTVPEHSYDAVKAVVTLEAPPEKVLAILRQIERYPRWYHGCKQTRVLERPPTLATVQLTADGRFIGNAVNESYLLFFLQDAPMLDDRWALVQNTVQVERDGSLAISFRSLDTRPYAAPHSSVRMRLRGQWLLSPLSRTRTRVSFVLDIDPSTDMPTFLVNPKIHQTAVQTLRNLRELASAH